MKSVTFSKKQYNKEFLKPFQNILTEENTYWIEKTLSFFYNQSVVIPNKHYILLKMNSDLDIIH